MHFHDMPDNLPKSLLDHITNQAIQQCLETHCTCDAHVELGALAFVLEIDSLDVTAMGSLIIRHEGTCYASGRNN